ncbi:YncE family protein [Weissella confusa]|uniref:YncE family protein n=1 Tax=Weissella confusa TaxID=1583 RepID=UPI0018F1108F|nr:hypothetical protein [Weissella confusa]MBJ7624806.1 hypothetical protein [Weissella confusa]MBJ7676204.1 hypothetical protein [Weissella confusa]
MQKNKVIIIGAVLVALLTAVGVQQVHFPGAFVKYNTTEIGPHSETSTEPLYSSGRFREAMAKYAALKQGMKIETTIPGMQGAWSLNAKTNELMLGNSFDPQGLAISDRNIYISAYDHSRQMKSIIYVIDRESGKYLKTVVLAGQYHAGGISYDADHDMLWVAGNKNGVATLYAIAEKVIDNYDIKQEKPVAYQASFNLLTTYKASTVTYYNNKLLVGYFDTSDFSNIQQFDITQKTDGTMMIGNRFPGMKTDYVVGNKIVQGVVKLQGLATNGQHLLVTSSFGNHDSKLVRYDVDADENLTGAQAVVLPPYLESVVYDGTTNRYFLLFESSTPAYRVKTKAVVDRVISMSANQFNHVASTYKSMQRATTLTIPQLSTAEADEISDLYTQLFN